MKETYVSAEEMRENNTTTISLKQSQTMIFGLKSSGKSNFLQWLLDHHDHLYSSHLVYDVCREHDVLNRYLPTHRRGDEAEAELNGSLEQLVIEVDRDQRPEIVTIEEISRFCSPRSPPPEAVYEMIDMNRHLDVGLVGIARRPAQVHPDLVELAENLIIFRLTGKNDHKRLEREVEGLGDAVRDLDDYEFVYVGPDRSYTVCSPVPEMDTTGSL